VPPAHPPSKHKVDPAWLRTEYVDRRRTLPDLAAEVGTTPSTIARIACRHGIPLRERGGASHEASLTAPAGFPEPLANAVLGQGGVERVHRFQVFARTPSLNQAARLLGVSQATLSVQLARLEQACGGPLLVRSPRTHRPQQVTPLGHQLLSQADEHLGPHPLAPKDHPEPLASALSSFRGEDRVRRFQVAARLPRLADAARHFGADLGTFNRALRGLEEACGESLFMRSATSRPRDLTAAGRLLLRQADEHFGEPIGFARIGPTNGSQPRRTVGKDGARAQPNSAAR
jgi:DNA-binding MarR family transcriptional regulator